jgi:hypothetical protein
MNLEATKKELDAAYASLEKAEDRVGILLKEMKQMQMVLIMLETAGYIENGKLEEAKELASTFCI